MNVWEKGEIEHFNSMIRKIYPKCFDFALASQAKINKINEINCESLNFKLAFELYMIYVKLIWQLKLNFPFYLSK